MNSTKISKPIFVTGQSNSGTKVLFFSLLYGHQDLCGFTLELHNYGICPQISDGTPPRLYSLYPTFQQYYAQKAEKQEGISGFVKREKTIKMLNKNYQKFKDTKKFVNGSRWLFKDPRLGLRIKWIKDIWPESQILILIRNPIAVAEGIRRRNGNRPDIPTAAAQYLVTYQIMQEDSQKFKKSIKWLKYEDMCESTTYPSKEDKFWGPLLSWLNLDPNKFIVPSRTGYSKIHKVPIAKNLQNLSNWEIAITKRICKPIIKDFNYGK